MEELDHATTIRVQNESKLSFRMFCHYIANISTTSCTHSQLFFYFRMKLQSLCIGVVAIVLFISHPVDSFCGGKELRAYSQRTKAKVKNIKE